MQMLFGIIRGIACDNELNNKELKFLKKWMIENKKLKGVYPYDVVFNMLNIILEKNVITENEKRQLLALFKKFLNPVTVDNKTINLRNKRVCLTGNFSMGTKAEVESKIEDLGGIVIERVNKTVDVLIVGNEGSSEWSYGNFGTKVKRAKELKEKGTKIDIISEKFFIENCINY